MFTFTYIHAYIAEFEYIYTCTYIAEFDAYQSEGNSQLQMLSDVKAQMGTGS